MMVYNLNMKFNFVLQGYWNYQFKKMIIYNVLPFSITTLQCEIQQSPSSGTLGHVLNQISTANKHKHIINTKQGQPALCLCFQYHTLYCGWIIVCYVLWESQTWWLVYFYWLIVHSFIKYPDCTKKKYIYI